MKRKLKEAKISFKIGNTVIAFIIYHNLPDIRGLNIENATECWLARTKDFTPRSLCDYINNKKAGLKALTVREYEKQTSY